MTQRPGHACLRARYGAGLLVLLAGALLHACRAPQGGERATESTSRPDESVAAEPSEATAPDGARAGAAPTPERPPLARFRGHGAFSSDRLEQIVRPLLDEYSGAGAGRAGADDAAFELRVFYQDHGYPLAHVDLVWNPDAREASDDARNVALFEITEGPLVTVSRITFQGNDEFDDERLANLWSGPRTGSGLLTEGELLYVEAEARAIVDRVREAYLRRGFQSVRVEGPRLQGDPASGRVALVYAVTEGPQYHLRELRFEGELALPEDELRALCAERLGKPWNARAGWELRGALLDHYGNAAHPKATVDFESLVSDEATGDVVVVFRIAAGPRVLIGEIRVEGLRNTERKTVLDRIGLRL